MLIAIAAVIASSAPAAGSLRAGDPCAGKTKCEQATAAQMFALADALAEQGDLAGAQGVLELLTTDPHPELRAEARFRLAAVREKLGDLAGAVRALRELLAEQPEANAVRLELSRLLAAEGLTAAAKRELARAEKAGLPPEIARTVGHFARLLNSTSRRGLSVALTAGPDSNINRATASQFIDTVIAPFELSPDARKQPGLGISASAQAYSRDSAGPLTILTQAEARGDFYAGRGRFDDVELSAGTGPEFETVAGRIRPALTLAARWFAGKPYSRTAGGLLSWVAPVSPKRQLEIDLSLAHQSVQANRLQSGTLVAASLTLDRQLSATTTGQLSVHGAVLDARARPESVRQLSVAALVARSLKAADLFGSVEFTRIWGVAPLALFGRTRDDRRVDVAAGVVGHELGRSFAPLMRVTYTNSSSSIALYAYKRVRLDIGLARDF